MTKQENELKRLVAGKVSAKKSNGQIRKVGYFLESFTKTKKVKDNSDNSNEDTKKEEDIRLFAKRYNQYIKKHKLIHCGKNLINFKKTYLHKKEDKKKEENVTCYECGKLGHYYTMCLSLNKRNKKNDTYTNMTKNNHAKYHMAYIAWE